MSIENYLKCSKKLNNKINNRRIEDILLCMYLLYIIYKTMQIINVKCRNEVL